MQCKASFSVTHGVAYDEDTLGVLFTTMLLPQHINTACLQSFGFGESATSKKSRDKQERMKIMFYWPEEMFDHVIVEHNSHNLPFCCTDNFSKLIKSMCPDSGIASMLSSSNAQQPRQCCFPNLEKVRLHEMNYCQG